MEDSNSTLTSSTDNTLRRRMNILERAHSLSKLNHKSSDETSHQESHAAMKKPQDFRGNDEEHEPEDEPDLSGSGEYESETDDSSRTEGNSSPTKRNFREDENERLPSQKKHAEHRPVKARSWYEFDLAVVAALVSPVAQWLTGGDHIKNLLFVLLLIFYLHQVIEIPWTLYHNSRPRVRPRSLRASAAAENSDAKNAISELRLFEFVFLSFAVVSPFLGASLLRYVTFSVTGQDIHSWFSIGLFVLATGVRPWTHLVQRFTQRVTDLHDIVHYHSAAEEEANSQDVSEMKQELEHLRGRLTDMEKSVMKLKKRLLKETNGVYDYVDEQVESVEQMVKKHEKALDYVLHLPSTLLVPPRTLKTSSSSPRLSPIGSPSQKYFPPSHSGTTSPVAMKLETIHEEGKEMRIGGAGGSKDIRIVPPKTVIIRSSPPSPRNSEPWPSILRPMILVMSLMTVPLLVFVHIVYASTFPLRWSFRTVIRLAGIEKTSLWR